MALQLSEFHREQVAKYLRFFRNKREVQVGEISELFQDAADARVDAGELLSPEEVSDLLQSLGDSVKSSFEDDLRRTVNMSVLAIQQLLEDADAQDLELQMDTSKIEDSHLIDEVEKLRFEAPAKNDARKTGRLVSLRDEQQRIVEENARLLKELAQTRKENEDLQDRCDQSDQRLSNATYELEGLRRQAAAAQSKGEESKEAQAAAAGEGSVVQLQDELDREREAASRLRAELADARDILLNKHGIDFDELCRSWKGSKQFQQMRKLLAQKTEQLTDLRRRMVQYEPDETQIDADGADEPLGARHK